MVKQPGDNDEKDTPGPIISVVIPTYARPRLLTRAIESVIASHKDDAFEILVVPNGPSSDWETIRELFALDARIHWNPISRASACAARNHGLEHARGSFIRFLDDDDELLPASSRQLASMSASHLDLSSAPLEAVARNGLMRGLVSVPRSEDFIVSAVLSIESVSLAQGTLYRRDALLDIRWREGAVLYDDYLWLLDVASKSEWAWAGFHEPVSRYIDHVGFRLSHVRRSRPASKSLVSALEHLRSRVHARQVNVALRDEATARALMTHAHSTFPLSPIRLTRALIAARLISATAMPMHAVFKRLHLRTPVLIALEWCLLPPRYISRTLKRLVSQRANLFRNPS